MQGLLIDPGRLRAEFLLLARGRASDGMGGRKEGWEEMGLCFGMIEPVNARAMTAGDRQMPLVTHRITLRFRSDVRSGMRFRRGSRTFDIQTIHDPDESGRYLVCLVREDGR
ncbi:phage head closure protein [Limoniibacter endophyticus]|uniref:Tail protein n=1 Tax=Limoniibacter endophyticus TaxID=1565040 RepID=A0A8J3DI65_9HYPH|nr:phage head closure protein [Limoniibacter endophyticus]GHC69327.1 tail protein [Limoniibacter endophyticus]